MLTPLAYFLTFSAYGARLHGEDRLTVDREHNAFGGRFVEESPRRFVREQLRMRESPYVLDPQSRAVVLRAILEVCRHRDWTPVAAHVRSNHVHIVLCGDTAPEKMMNDLKAYSSRALKAQGCDGSRRKRWARHGSTAYLFDTERANDAVAYTVHAQGRPMALYQAPRPYPWEAQEPRR